MTQLREWLAERENRNARDLALEIVKRHRDWAVSMVADRIENIRRGVVRAVEAQIADSIMAGVQLRDPVRLPAPALDVFADLMSQPFRLGNGTSVLWGEATLEQHEQRIAMLTKTRDGLNRTIERHAEAVQLLRTSGAPCLAALQEAVASAA
jgi:hypothetical protein